MSRSDSKNLYSFHNTPQRRKPIHYNMLIKITFGEALCGNK